MSRKVKLLALLLVLVLFGTSGEALAKSKRKKVKAAPAAKQGVKTSKSEKVNLITPSEAQQAVRKQLGTNKVKFFGKPELKNKAHDYPAHDYPAHGGYRPVYEMKCEAQGSRYNVDVDAVTAQVLKLAFVRK